MAKIKTRLLWYHPNQAADDPGKKLTAPNNSPLKNRYAKDGDGC